MQANNLESSGANGRLSDLYGLAVPEVYQYLRSRCGSTQLAEELTSATFVQAALVLAKPEPQELSVGWLVTVARNKLTDHWRREAMKERSLALIEAADRIQPVDPWEVVLDQARAHQVLQGLKPHYRSVLVLRYLDDLGVAECAEQLGRGIRSTESLLARARAAFRKSYEETGERDD